MVAHQKGQSFINRKITTVQDRVLMDAQKKARQVQRTLGDSASISAKAQETAKEAESIIKASAKVHSTPT